MTKAEMIKCLEEAVVSEAKKAEEYLWRAMDAGSLAEEKKWFERSAYAEACSAHSKARLAEARGG